MYRMMTCFRIAPRRALIVLAVLGVLVAGFALPVSAQLYRWTNERGEVHFTEGLESIPDRFRSSATLLGHPRPPDPPALSAPPPSAGDAGSVLARIPFVPGVPIVVSARVNGGRSVQLVLDTGADRTMIAPQTLSALGADMRVVRRAMLSGVTGTTEVSTVMLESIEVGQARVAPIEVLAHNPNLTRGEGLLGRDFLDRFIVNIDTRARVLQIGRR
jgi:predicted aspartyl protease